MSTMNRTLPRLALLAILGAGLSASGALAQSLQPGAGTGLGLGPRTSAAAAALPEAPAPVSSSDGIAAVVGNQVITRYDLDLRVRNALQAMQQQHQGQQLPTASQVRGQVLNEMIDEYALAEYAEESGIDVSDPTLQRAVGQIATNNHISLDQLRQQVSAQGMGWKDFEAQIKREILIARLRQRDVAAKVTVGEQDVDDFLARHDAGASAGGDVKLHLAQIFVPLPDHPTAADLSAGRDIIEHAAALLQQGRRFGVVARQFSQGPGALHGGDLGTRAQSQWPGLFVRAVSDLQPGQVSQVIRSPAGFHILKLLGREQAGALPQTAMQAQVREIVIDADNDHSRKAAVHELDAVRHAVESGEVSFAAKAKEISQDLSSAPKGGDLGWLLPGQLPPVLDAALDNLNPGEVSQPLLLPGKVVLLQLVDRREHALGPGQERAVARNLLLQRKEAKAFEELVQDVRERTYVRLPEDGS